MPWASGGSRFRANTPPFRDEAAKGWGTRAFLAGLGKRANRPADRFAMGGGAAMIKGDCYLFRECIYI